MRAAFYETNGAAAEVIRVGDVETPTPGPGEVRVRLACSGVNPSDVKSRAGLTRKIAFPRVIPHSDGAGEIDQVGDGVPPARVGERVWTWNAQYKRPFGTCAEYVVLPEAQAVRLPGSVGFDAGACLGIPAMTAWHAVALAGARPGTTLLVPGGAGGVGHYTVQFAKHRGAVVISTVSSPAKAEIARAAGADHVVNYRAEDVGERVREITGGRGVDAVVELDLLANAPLLPAVLAPRGSAVVYGTGGGEARIPAHFCLTNSIRLQFMLVYELTPPERAAAIEAITKAMVENRLLHNVAATFRLDETVAAHQTVENGAAMGNVVVRIA